MNSFGNIQVEPILCSITEAGRALGLGRSKVYELINEGNLETVHIGRRRLIHIESIEAFVNKRRST